MLKADYQNKGIQVNGKTFNKLHFDDDAVLLSKSLEECEELVKDLKYVRK